MVRTTTPLRVFSATLALWLAACANPVDVGRAPEAVAPPPAEARAYDEAIMHFQALRAEKPDEIEAVLGLARNLRWAGRVDEAARVLRDARPQFGDDGRFLAELGKVRLLQGDTTAGVDRLSEAADRVNDDWRLYSALGIALDYRADYPRAENAYLKALDMCPDDAAVMNNLGISRALAGRLDRAALTLEDALALDGHEAQIRQNLDLIRRVRDLCPNCGGDYLKQSGAVILAVGLRGTDREGPCTPEPEITPPTAMEAELQSAPSINIRVYFEFDSAILRPEALDTLDNLGEALTSGQLRDYRFEIAGHTDAVGTESYNLRLSRERADAVLAYLTDAFGIDPDRIDTVGYGESRLLKPDDPEADANRRVQVTRLGRAAD